MCTADEVNPLISRASFNSLTSATTLPPFSMCQSLTVTGRPKFRSGPLNYFGHLPLTDGLVMSVDSIGEIDVEV
jgi:hypothetical protein